MARKSIPRVTGIGAGLVPRDLNARAQLALMGLSDTPAEDIAALLRSDQPIEAKTRQKLASALEHKGRGLHFKPTNRAASQTVKRILRDISRLRQGQYANRIKAGIGGQKAIEKLAGVIGKDRKSAEACVTLANKVDAWIAKVRRDQPECAQYGDLELEVAFIVAQHDKVSPSAPHDDDAIRVAMVIKEFMRLQDRALSHDEWFMG